MNTGRSKKLVRYLLFELENYRSRSERDFEADPGTIEHILPENPNEVWEETFPPNIQEIFIDRLGNYVLLDASKNRECGTLNFPSKNAYRLKIYIQWCVKCI